MEKSHIRILCADDHVVVREGLAAIIHQEPDMSVVSSVGTGEDAVDQYRIHRPHVVLMDLRLPVMTGIQAIREIRLMDANARILVLTMYHGDEDIYRALEAGAAGYLLKDTLADNLIHVIREIQEGRSAISPAIAVQLVNRMNRVALTAREEEIMRLIAKGMRNKEIGVVLEISEETVQAHVKNIFTKLKVHDRTAALAIAIQRGIIHVD